MKILGSKSGFRTARDLLLFCVGLGTLIFHLVSVAPKDYNVAILLFCGGMMGAPYIIGKDEEKK